MKKIVSYSMALLLSATMLTSCDNEDNSASRPFNLTTKQFNTIEQNNKFAFNIYRKLSLGDNADKSLVFSPWSATYLLSMLNAGTLGQGSEEIINALGFEGSTTEEINELCQTMLFHSPRVDQKVTLWQANCIVANKDVTLKDDYVDDMDFYYIAEVTSKDFSDPTTITYINNWCKERTNGLIPKIIDELDPSACMVLMNAIYFNAPWESKFKEEKTKKLRFTKEDGTSKLQPLMCKTSNLAYGINDTYATARLPYGNGKTWNMYVLLPNEGKKVKDVLASLTPTSWKANVAQMTSKYDVNLRLPRFESSSELTLNDALKALGITAMFEPGMADFSRMTEIPNVFINIIKQKATIIVKEKGTEAAAVTFTGEDSALPEETQTVDFYADHPFVYLIQEASSGAIFFIGTYHGE
jgi:serpin B